MAAALRGEPQRTLGDVLQPARSAGTPPEREWLALVRSCGAGDQAALHALYERANRPVFTLLLRLTNSRETSEELVVEVFHEIWRRAPAYSPDGRSVLGWVMNLARSRATDRLHLEQRKNGAAPELPDALERATLGERQVLESKREAVAVRRALATLSPAEQQALEYAYFAGLTYAEVAEQTRQPLGTVKTRLRAGLQKLRAALQPSGVGP